MVNSFAINKKLDRNDCGSFLLIAKLLQLQNMAEQSKKYPNNTPRIIARDHSVEFPCTEI